MHEASTHSPLVVSHTSPAAQANSPLLQRGTHFPPEHTWLFVHRSPSSIEPSQSLSDPSQSSLVAGVAISAHLSWPFSQSRTPGPQSPARPVSQGPPPPAQTRPLMKTT